MNIEVVLTQDDPSLGKRGDIVKVSPGHAHNFLIPQKRAKLATAQNLKEFKEEKARRQKLEAEMLASARETAQKVAALVLRLGMSAGEGDKLYGAVTSQDIQKALEGQGIRIEKRQVHIEEPIRRIGVYEVTLKLHHDVTAQLKVQVDKKP